MAAVAVWFWVLPVSQDCSSLNLQLDQLRAQNQANRRLEGQGTVLQQRVAEAEARLQAVKSMVPDEPDTDTLVSLLRESESSSGVHIRSFTSQAAVTAEEYVELPYKLHVDGTYFALLSFFDRLAGATRIISVSGLSLVVPVPGGRGSYKLAPSETVATDFTLSAYYNHQAGPKPAPAKR
jgi:type IV pilus assembly protein PilO